MVVSPVFLAQQQRPGRVVSQQTGASGRQAAKARTVLDAKEVRRHLQLYFPQGAVHHVTPPNERALCHRLAPGQATVDAFFGRRGANRSSPWDATSMRKAASEFEIPRDTTILLFFPEIFDLDILRQYSQFRVGQTGIRMPCPWCKTNTHVTIDNKTGYKKGSHRTILGYRTRIPIYTAIATCRNPNCSGKPSGKVVDGSDLAAPHTFHLSDPSCYNQYPHQLKERYCKWIFTQASEGNGREVLVTEELCLELLKDETIFSGIHRSMATAFHCQQTRAIRVYAEFTVMQRPFSGDVPWPDFDCESYNMVFCPVGEKSLAKIFNRCLT